MTEASRCFVAVVATSFWILVVSGTTWAAPASPPTEPIAGVDPFLLPASSPVDPNLAELSRRQQMLQWHQGLAVGALALGASQLILGTWFKEAVEGAAGFTAAEQDRLRLWHRGLGIATAAVYWSAASLAIFAPPNPRTGRLDAIAVHKALAWVHGLGMAITPLLGFYIARSANDLDPGRLERLRDLHQGIATVTVAALAGAALTIVLDWP